MDADKKPYHHGDLYRCLITAAKEIIQTTGLSSLSIRKLAEKTNVSRSAPYHHFNDKNELLCAVAEDGFLQQKALIEKELIASSETDPALRLEAFILKFLRFAIENKEQYDLMYGATIWKDGTPTEALSRTSAEGFELWTGALAKMQQDGIIKHNLPPLRLSQVAWAALHGMCCQANERVYIDPNDIDDIGRTAVRIFLDR